MTPLVSRIMESDTQPTATATYAPQSRAGRWNAAVAKLQALQEEYTTALDKLEEKDYPTEADEEMIDLLTEILAFDVDSLEI